MPDRRTAVRIAAVAGCDPRTARRYFDPQWPISPLAESAIRHALRELAIPDPRATKALPHLTP